MDEKMGKMKIIYGNFSTESARRDIEFLSNSLMALGVEEIIMKIPPEKTERVPVDGSLRFRLFGSLIGGSLVELVIEAPMEVLSYLEEELGSGLSSAIITVEATSRLAMN